MMNEVVTISPLVQWLIDNPVMVRFIFIFIVIAVVLWILYLFLSPMMIGGHDS